MSDALSVTTIPPVPQQPYLLDISRSLSRAGAGPDTGIDRVELAYIRHLLTAGQKPLFITRLGKRFALLDHIAVAKFLDIRKRPEDFIAATFPDNLRLRLDKSRRAIQSWCRKSSICQGSAARVAGAVRALFPNGFDYLNVGHSNLSAVSLRALKATPGSRLRVMIHDMIPLDYPEFTRPGMEIIFKTRMQATARYADEIICNSNHTKRRVEHYFSTWGVQTKTLVAPLGIEPVPHMTTPHQPQTEPRYFITLGTIEPRKNHMILLQAWEKMAAEALTQNDSHKDIPRLYIVGRRGWENHKVFDFLDQSPLIRHSIFEMNDLNDAQLAPMLAGATALLFPSFCEGYGLPALEAAQINLPVICSDIDVFHELLGSYPDYLSPDAMDGWVTQIKAAAACIPGFASKATHKVSDLPDVKITRWESHFQTVLI